ncbi:MAG: spore germination protein [Bacillota bacterium]|jgi:spore germination protein KA
MRKPRKPLKLWEKKAQELAQAARNEQAVSFTGDFETNCGMIEEVIRNCNDVGSRTFTIPWEAPRKARLYYMVGLTDKDMLNESILAPLTSPAKVRAYTNVPDIISSFKVQEVQKLNLAINHLFDDLTLLVVDGSPSAWIIDTRLASLRTVDMPETEPIIRGPRDSFIEDLETNISLIRKRIKSPLLKNHALSIGRITRTKISVLYLEGTADPKVLEELHSRLKQIDIDGVMDTGQLEQLIEDNSFSPFPQISNTERPDSAAAALLDGRVVILADNTPFALILPTVLTDMLQSNEDYYQRFHFASAIRFLRYIMFALALLGPALFIGITTYHNELIPTVLLLRIISTRVGMPFPAILEALLMELAFEALREAGLRLPRPAGQTVGIVGALVIGQAAVQAGIVSPIMVIVVAGTGIASFTIPGFSLALSIRLLRFIFMLLAAVLGLHGVNLGISVLLVHLVSLRSFGVPYLTPMAPITPADWKDLVVRGPIWWLTTRPTFIAKDNVRRQGYSHGQMQPKREEGNQ